MKKNLYDIFDDYVPDTFEAEASQTNELQIKRMKKAVERRLAGGQAAYRARKILKTAVVAALILALSTVGFTGAIAPEYLLSIFQGDSADVNELFVSDSKEFLSDNQEFSVCYDGMLGDANNAYLTFSIRSLGDYEFKNDDAHEYFVLFEHALVPELFGSFGGSDSFRVKDAHTLEWIMTRESSSLPLLGRSIEVKVTELKVNVLRVDENGKMTGAHQESITKGDWSARIKLRCVNRSVRYTVNTAFSAEETDFTVEKVKVTPLGVLLAGHYTGANPGDSGEKKGDDFTQIKLVAVDEAGEWHECPNVGLSCSNNTFEWSGQSAEILNYCNMKEIAVVQFRPSSATQTVLAVIALE